MIYSEQSLADLKARNAGGLVTPLPPAGPLSDESLDACNHIVALLGPEPYMAAIAAGADIVLGGRTTDTAVLAAVPLMRGADVAAAWHAAKIAECGGLCTINPTSPGVMMSIDRRASPSNRCRRKIAARRKPSLRTCSTRTAIRSGWPSRAACLTSPMRNTAPLTNGASASPDRDGRRGPTP